MNFRGRVILYGDIRFYAKTKELFFPTLKMLKYDLKRMIV